MENHTHRFREISHEPCVSLRKKFDLLFEQTQGIEDMLMICETKIDNSFPNDQFQIAGFNIPFRLSKSVGDAVILIREGIIAKLLYMYKFNESHYIEINL